MATITLIATIPAILALVNLAKQFGVTGKWSALLAVFLGVLVQAAEYGFLTDDLSRSGWYGAIATGLILGLSAAGLYDVARTVSPEIPPAELTVDDSWLPGEAAEGVFIGAPVESDDQAGDEHAPEAPRDDLGT